MRCPITYSALQAEERYSAQGLKLLSEGLKGLKDFPYTASEQLREARLRAGKLSIQGVQPKLSARLAVKAQTFELVDRGGTFILKPQHRDYPELPENEDLSMRLAAAAGIEVPLHGLLHSADDSFSYFIRRFDRYGRGKKRVQEDFAQLLGRSRDTKYDSSTEQVISVLDDHCTFPALEKVKLFRRTLFSFIIGNEDMHLKNFSLLGREGKIELSPAYDLLNSTLYLPAHAEEMALTLKGKKRNITYKTLFHYLALERLGLQPAVIEGVVSDFVAAFPAWQELIAASFLSSDMRDKYSEFLRARCVKLKLSFG